MLAASLMAMYAVSIDAAVPALFAIGTDLGASQINQGQHVISALILGMAIGQMFYGPLSDSVGRKPAIYLGLVLCALGFAVSAFAESFTAMLAGRFLQGLGAAGPRTVTIALIRDRYQGPAMARTLSFVMAVFVTLPIVASILAQGVLSISGWRTIFASLLVWDLVVLAWLARRQPETLPRERRQPFSLRPLVGAVRETIATRDAVCYTVAAGFVLGAWFGYVNSARQVFQDIYGVGRALPFYYSVATLAFGIMSLVNARLVLKIEIHRLCRVAAISAATLSCLFFVFALLADGRPPLWATVVYIAALFPSFGVLISNFTSLAMAPLGHVAGVASGVVSSLMWLLALILGALIGQRFDGTLLPLVAGFAILSIAALMAMQQASPKT